MALDECSTARIGFGLTGMMLAIDFDDESPRSADEIREVWTDRVLATEFDARQPMGTDKFPTDSFGFTAIATSLTRLCDAMDVHAPYPLLSR